MKRRGTNTGAYIGEMAWELAKLARAEGQDSLGYLLEVAALEAEANGSEIGKFRPASKGQHEGQRLRQ